MRNSAPWISRHDVAVVLVRHGETEWSSSGKSHVVLRCPPHAARLRPGSHARGPVGRRRVLARADEPDVNAPARRAPSPVSPTAPRSPTISAEWDYGEYEGRTMQDDPNHGPRLDDLPRRRAGRRDRRTGRRARRSRASRRVRRRRAASSRSSRTGTSSACSARAGSGSRHPAGALLGLDTATLSLPRPRTR